ncbi:hypothetical protein ACFLYL_03300 [Chloroflexota bacterium]
MNRDEGSQSGVAFLASHARLIYSCHVTFSISNNLILKQKLNRCYKSGIIRQIHSSR